MVLRVLWEAGGAGWPWSLKLSTCLMVGLSLSTYTLVGGEGQHGFTQSVASFFNTIPFLWFSDLMCHRRNQATGCKVPTASTEPAPTSQLFFIFRLCSSCPLAHLSVISLLFRFFLGIKDTGEKRKMTEETVFVSLEAEATMVVIDIYSIFWLVEILACVSQVLTDRELHHTLLAIPFKQFLFKEGNLAYVMYVLDRFFLNPTSSAL